MKTDTTTAAWREFLEQTDPEAARIRTAHETTDHDADLADLAWIDAHADQLLDLANTKNDTPTRAKSTRGRTRAKSARAQRRLGQLLAEKAARNGGTLPGELYARPKPTSELADYLAGHKLTNRDADQIAKAHMAFYDMK